MGMTIKEFMDLTIEDRRLVMKRLVNDLIHNSEAVPCKAIADRLQKNYANFCNWGQVNSHRNIPLEHLIAVMHLAGSLKILDFIEALFGRAAFALPQAGAGLAEINRESARAVKEFGELLHEAADAAEDGIITRAELARIQKEGREAMGQIAQLLAAARQMHLAQGDKTEAGPIRLKAAAAGGKGK